MSESITPGESGTPDSSSNVPFVSGSQVPPVAPASQVPAGAGFQAPSAMKPVSVLSTKIPSTVVFGIGLLLFLMPFLDIRCNTVSIQKVSGIQLATGFKVEAPGSNNSIFGKLDGLDTSDNKEPLSNKGGNPYAIAALLLSIASLALAFSSRKSAITGAMITGVLGGIALIGLMIDVKNAVGAETQGDEGIVIAVIFTPWFYISLLAALAGAFLCFRRRGFISPPYSG